MSLKQPNPAGASFNTGGRDPDSGGPLTVHMAPWPDTYIKILRPSQVCQTRPKRSLHRQQYLESAFPAHAPSSQEETSATGEANRTSTSIERGSDEKKTARSGASTSPPKLNIRNTVIKTVLDQTAGAAVNTVLFLGFSHWIRAAMSHRAFLDGGKYAPAAASAAFLASGETFDVSRVDAATILAQVGREFVPVMMAGWRLWPLVSVVNFSLVKTVEGRNLVGCLAGMIWGIYISLFTAGDH